MYTRMKELLEQVLLEFDPKTIAKRKKSKDPFFRGSKDANADRQAQTASRDALDRSSTKHGSTKSVKSRMKKAKNRALARGGEGDLDWKH